VLVVAIVGSRTLSRLIHRRISKRGLYRSRHQLHRHSINLLPRSKPLECFAHSNLHSSWISLRWQWSSPLFSVGNWFRPAVHSIGHCGRVHPSFFERPIRVGDRVTIDKDEGDVRSINLRTTIVETNDRIGRHRFPIQSSSESGWSTGPMAIPRGAHFDSHRRRPLILTLNS